MYHILVKTIPHNLSIFLSHIVEHSILWNKKTSLEEFFFRSTGYTSFTHTRFEVQNNISKHDIVQKLLWNIDQDVYEYEKKILKKELSIYQKDEWAIILSQIYGYADFDIYQDTDFNTVAMYHKTYYKPENIVLYDENRKVIGEQPCLKEASSTKLDLSTLKHYFQSSVNKNRVYILSADTWKNVIFMYFLCNLFNYNYTKKKRYELWEYDFKSYSGGMTMKDIYFRWPPIDEYIVTKEFFSGFKSAFIEKIKEWYHNKPLAYWILYNKQIVTDEAISSFIEHLNYNDIISIMTKPLEQFDDSLKAKWDRANEFQQYTQQSTISFDDFSKLHSDYIHQIELLKKAP